jgi:predicted DCC family thiol-disulfide oxidoreductase YuxK
LAEIHFLKHHNQNKLLNFISLHALGGNDHEINCELAFKTIHARLGEKEIITGPDVFFEAYKRTDLKVINFLFSFRLFRFFYAKFYTIFAKHRHKISKLIGPSLLNFVQRKYPDAMK